MKLNCAHADFCELNYVVLISIAINFLSLSKNMISIKENILIANQFLFYFVSMHTDHGVKSTKVDCKHLKTLFSFWNCTVLVFSPFYLVIELGENCCQD